MDNNKKLFEGLLKADGINPACPTESERIAFGKMLNEQPKPKRSKPSIARLDIWRIIMKSRIAKLAIAAVIIIAVLIGINQFGGSIDGASVVWANTLGRIYEATSVAYKKTFEGDKANPFYFEEMINENGVMRAVIGGSINIHALSEGKALQLVPSRKEAILTHYVGLKRSTKPYNQLKWLISIKDEAGEFIGTEDIDGTLANKFFWQRGEYDNVTVWVDPSTDLPLRVEQAFLQNPDKNIVQPFIMLNLGDFGGSDAQSLSVGGMGGKGIQKKMILIMKDFIWNQQLDPAFFSVEPPEDYTLRETQHDATDSGENDLIKALAFWTKMSGGTFPQRINDLIDPNQINPMLIEKFDKDGNPLVEATEAMKQATIITKGLFFAQEKKADKNWHYVGGGVRLGKAEAPICWWYAEDSDDYRMIYGDLSIGNSLEIPRTQEDE